MLYSISFLTRQDDTHCTKSFLKKKFLFLCKTMSYFSLDFKVILIIFQIFGSLAAFSDTVAPFSAQHFLIISIILYHIMHKIGKANNEKLQNPVFVSVSMAVETFTGFEDWTNSSPRVKSALCVLSNGLTLLNLIVPLFWSWIGLVKAVRSTTRNAHL